MRQSFIFLIIFVLANELFAQNVVVQPPKRIQSRSVSGIVQDSTDTVLSGAIVTLTSKIDTLKTRTNDEGLFFFKDVKAWEFTLSVSSLGYRTYVNVGKYNDTSPRLTLQPVVLRGEYQILKEVIIDGTPSITYKIDTVEYRAKDYIVREGSSVDELLKKMEGMDVGKDGSLTFNGSPVDKVRLNGKDFMGGSISSAIQSLPAEIVDRIQVVDDYGDEASRTGIKLGVPSKLLNITTKADRSIGYIAKISGGGGNNNRYNANLNGTRINANQNFTLAGGINNTVNGIAGNGFFGSNIVGPRSAGPNDSGISGGSGGTTTKTTAAFTYRDDWSSKARVNFNYLYNLTNSDNLYRSISQDFSTRGTTFSTNESSGNNYSNMHNLMVEFEADLDSANYLKITPTLSYQSVFDENYSSGVYSGLIRQDQLGKTTQFNAAPNYGVTAFYQHLFPKKGRNISLQLSSSKRDTQQEREQNANILFYNQTTNVILKDSLIHRSIERSNLINNFRSSLTYSEPLSNTSTLQFNGQINYNGYDNRAVTSNLITNVASIVDSLSNIFNYSFTQARLSLNYRHQIGKKLLSLGVTGVPATLSGSSISLGTVVNRVSFNVIPIFRYDYSWTATRQLSLYYSGSIIEPSFDQIQPVRDLTNPQYSIIGNPSLKATFIHTLNGGYRNYFANSRFNFNAGLNATYYNNRVASNILQVNDAYNSLKYERHFFNVDGAYLLKGNYTITKQLSDRRYNFTMAGNINYQHDIGMSNNTVNLSKQWLFVENIGAKISPSEKLEVNPSISYMYYRTDNSLPSALDSRTNIISMQISGRFYFGRAWLVGYDGSENFVKGINSNLAGNPTIFNLYLERQFFKRNAGKVRVHAFDIFNENKLINRNSTETSITDTRSNRLSRYFMASLTLNLQQWKGIPTRKGKQMQRRGDGSFIY